LPPCFFDSSFLRSYFKRVFTRDDSILFFTFRFVPNNNLFRARRVVGALPVSRSALPNNQNP